MDTSSVLIVTGPPGAGKTTVARRVAERFEPAACLEADWFWTTIVRGYVPPWQPGSGAQNEGVIRAVFTAASAMATAGYRVVVDGIVGPWYLPIAIEEISDAGRPVDYVVLRPSLPVALARATARAGDERVAGHPALTDEAAIRHMWDQFADLGVCEPHAIDTSALDVDRTVERVLARLDDGSLRV